MTTIALCTSCRRAKNFNRKCDVDVNVNADDRGDNNSSVHFVQASLKSVFSPKSLLFLQENFQTEHI